MSLRETVSKPIYNIVEVFNTENIIWGIPTTGPFFQHRKSGANYIWNNSKGDKLNNPIKNEIVEFSLYYYNSSPDTLYPRLTCICDNYVDFYFNGERRDFDYFINSDSFIETNWPNGGYIKENGVSDIVLPPYSYSIFTFKCTDIGANNPAGLAVICESPFGQYAKVLFTSNADTVYNIQKKNEYYFTGDFVNYPPYFMWNNLHAQESYPINDQYSYPFKNEILEFTYVYNNILNIVDAKISCFCDNYVLSFMVNDTKITYDTTSYITQDIKLSSGLNTFKFLCKNIDGITGVAIICRSLPETGSSVVLFNSNLTLYPSWTVKNKAASWNSPPPNDIVYNIPNIYSYVGPTWFKNFFTKYNTPSFMWNTPYAHIYAQDNSYLEFKYQYNNNTGNNLSANLLAACDNYLNLVLVNNVEKDLQNDGNVEIVLKPGLNTFNFFCSNSYGPAAFGVICISGTNVLFNSNLQDFPSWTVNTPVSPYCYKGYTLSDMIYLNAYESESVSVKSSFLNNVIQSVYPIVDPTKVNISSSNIYQINNIDIPNIAYYTEIKSSCFVTPPIWCNAMNALLIGGGGGAGGGPFNSNLTGGGGGEIIHFNNYITVSGSTPYYIRIGSGGVKLEGGATVIYSGDNVLLQANGGKSGGVGGTGGQGGIGIKPVKSFSGNNGGAFVATTKISEVSKTTDYEFYGKGGKGFPTQTNITKYANYMFYGCRGNQGLAVLYFLNIDNNLPTTGLVFQLTFGSSTFPTTDSIGGSTLTPITNASYPSSPAMFNDATRGYVLATDVGTGIITNFVPNTPSWSRCFWLKRNTTGDGYTLPTPNFPIYFANNLIEIEVDFNFSSSIVHDTTNRGQDWVHYVFTYDRTINLFKLYVNGNAVSNTLAYQFSTEIQSLCIGNINETTKTFGANQYFDDIYCYSRALSAVEVLSVYNHGDKNRE